MFPAAAARNGAGAWLGRVPTPVITSYPQCKRALSKVEEYSLRNNVFAL
ncbi:hypothetical protein BURPS305_3771 [Burkholderia pseudomallei 305]|nr:hypothetical protein BURPS305_3771 [Burkholderia pseudomallei 305]